MDIDYRKIIESRYNRQNWQLLLRDIFKSRVEFWATPYEISTNSPMAKQALWLGTITLSDDETIAIYEVELSDSVDIERNRRGIRDMLLTEWRNRDAGAFMFCYRKTESVLRFSYVSESWNFAEDGTYQKESTDTKRYTYLLGEGHRSRTAIQQFEELKKSDLNLKALTKAFSVEAVSKMFFDEYKKNYEDIIQFITGKRMVKVANKWEEQVKNEPCEAIMQEFAHFPDPEKSVRDYVKKLMGRLVFLQFLQKKGWLGVKNGEWGSGDAEFLQTLFKNCDDKDHFVDKVLEELFNELNTEHDVEASHFKVPYLNGGLFEREATDETEFPLPAKYMQQILDFFASYNFTIDENDPDDAEVGVDPEMLGRIFENLLEDNKDKGAFYTPKEIVTYMCRESLIAYLQTDIDDEEIKEAIRQFVTTHHKNDKLPSDIDQKLKDVKICDPAIGSGAFPMGLLKELFQCRTALEGIEQSKAAEIKKHIIQNNIYGVDIERGAVDIARLRFWLSLIVDEETPQALPNLDYKIVEGNSLITTFDGQYIDLEKGKGEARYRPSLINIQKEKKLLQEEQKRFFTLSGEEKYRSEIEIKKHILNTIWYQLDFEKHSWQDATIEQVGLFGSTESKGRKKNKAQVVEFTQDRQVVLDKCEEMIAQLNDETKSIKERANLYIPFFEWSTVFSDIFDVNKNGFDIVIGNPPYGADLSESLKDHLKIKYDYLVERLRNSYLYFMGAAEELAPRGIISYIVPNEFLFQIYMCKARRHFLTKARILQILNIGESAFDAVVPTCIFLFSHEVKQEYNISLVDLRDKDIIKNTDVLKNITFGVMSNNQIYSNPLSTFTFDFKKSNLISKLLKCPKCFDDYCEDIFNGVSTSCNEVYLATPEIVKRFNLESHYIKPTLKGENVTRFHIPATPPLYLLYIKSDFDFNIAPNTKRYLENQKSLLVKKSVEKRKGIRPWYELFRARNEDSLKRHPKIIIRQTGDSIIAAIDYHGYYSIDSTNIIIIKETYCSFIEYFVALLNSRLIKFYYQEISQEGGRVLAQVKPIRIKSIPIPEASDEAKSKIASLVKEAISKRKMDSNADISKIDYQIDKLIYQLYGLTEEDIAIIEGL